MRRLRNRLLRLVKNPRPIVRFTTFPLLYCSDSGCDFDIGIIIVP